MRRLNTHLRNLEARRAAQVFGPDPGRERRRFTTPRSPSCRPATTISPVSRHPPRKANGTMTHLDIAIAPQHQQIAARLALAFVDSAEDRLGLVLAEVGALDSDGALAVLAVQSRNLAAALTGLPSLDEAARAALQRTILDAGMAGDE